MKRQYGALRGLAIFLVVLNHSITLSTGFAAENNFGDPAPAVNVILISLQSLGVLAVPTFYFISGGFQAFGLQGKTMRSSYQVIAKALPHIFIPYVIWSFLFYVLLFTLQGELYTLPEYVKFLIVGYPHNFVPLLVFFYLLSPVLIRLISRWPWKTLMAIVLYQVATLIILRPLIFGVELPSWAQWLTIPGLRLSIALWGIFFPLGIAAGLHGERFTAIVGRTSIVWWILSALTYIGHVLHELGAIRISLLGVALPLFVVLMFPIVLREAIPFVHRLEQLGRRSYGLYLSNLIWINIGILITHAIVPGFFTQILLLQPLLILFTIAALWILMGASEKLQHPFVRRFVFG